jgi:putative heme iron utilization protein
MTPNLSEVGAEARELLYRAYDGVLSTHSVEMPGYPFGSVVPYCLDRRGRPVILIANIAQHTRNITANPKVSLLVLDRSVDDVQANGRLTLLADACPVPSGDLEETAERYYSFFPDSRDYHKTHAFAFHRLEPVRLRYIGGFGRIHWLTPDDVLRANPFTAEEECAMVRHMNEDHSEALRGYCARAGVSLPPGGVPVMAGVDGEGFHLRVGARIVRFSFATPVATPSEVRAALVQMARAEAF